MPSSRPVIVRGSQLTSTWFEHSYFSGGALLHGQLILEEEVVPMTAGHGGHIESGGLMNLSNYGEEFIIVVGWHAWVREVSM